MTVFNYRYSIIPAGAVTDRTLEPRDLQVLCLLGRHTDRQGWCFRSQVKMAQEIDCGRSSIQRSLERLYTAGWVERRLRSTADAEADAKHPYAAHAYRVRLDRDDVMAETVTEEQDSTPNPSHDETATHEPGCPPVGTPLPTRGHPGAHPYVGTPCPPIHGHHKVPLEPSPVEPERESRGREKRALGLVAFEQRWPTAAADDRQRTAYAWEALSPDECEAALAGIGPFLENLKRHKRANVPAGWKYLEQKRWSLIEQAAATVARHGGPYVPTSETGKALRMLARIAHTSLPQLGDGRLIYIRPITPQLLALASCDPDSGEVYKIGSKNFGAWREFLREHVTNLCRLEEIQAPWPWPPKADGSIYSGSDPPPLVPGTLATDEDLAEMDITARG